MMLKLKMDQMRGDNRQLTKQVVGLLGDTIFALIIGMLCLVVLGGVVSALWSLIAQSKATHDQPYTKYGIQICGYLNINISSDSG